MIRKYLAAVTAFVALSAVGIVSGTGCNSTGVGDPCVPEQEYAPDFLGFDYHEVNIESKSFQCETRLCLVNHFQGRVSCPYGQNASATGAYGTSGSGFKCGGTPTESSQCCTPGVLQPVISDLDTSGTPTHSDVLPNCVDRTADKAVYCSCRCANSQGQTNDGANYCSCPSGYSCSQLVTSIGLGDQGLSGAYCVKNGTQYDPTNCLRAEALRLDRSRRPAREPATAATTKQCPVRVTRRVGAPKKAVADHSSGRVRLRPPRVELAPRPLEIDLVARKGDLVTAVEVRTRRPGAVQGAFASFNEDEARPAAARGGEVMARAPRGPRRRGECGSTIAAVSFDGRETKIDWRGARAA